MEDIQNTVKKFKEARKELSKAIIGQENVVSEVFMALLADGHILLEGVPGLGKTLLVRSLAKVLQLDFHRVQFTPDLMPADIIGMEVLEEDRSTGKRFFQFNKGPIFTNILLCPYLLLHFINMFMCFNSRLHSLHISPIWILTLFFIDPFHCMELI